MCPAHAFLTSYAIAVLFIWVDRLNGAGSDYNAERNAGDTISIKEWYTAAESETQRDTGVSQFDRLWDELVDAEATIRETWDFNEVLLLQASITFRRCCLKLMRILEKLGTTGRGVEPGDPTDDPEEGVITRKGVIGRCLELKARIRK
jgi:hypothetical protein